MPPKEQISAIKNAVIEVLSILEGMLQSGEDISDELERVVADLINAAAQKISELKQQENTPTPLPELNQQMPSSNVHSFGYDEKNGKLLVKFQGNGGYGQGPVYAYDNVPKAIFDLFQRGAVPARTDGQNKWGKWWKGKVPSLGASLYTLIKEGGYAYQKLG